MQKIQCLAVLAMLVCAMMVSVDARAYEIPIPRKFIEPTIYKNLKIKHIRIYSSRRWANFQI